MAHGIVSDAACGGCIYYSKPTKSSAVAMCDYYLDTGERRGCEGGEGCTKKKIGTMDKKARRIAFALS